MSTYDFVLGFHYHTPILYKGGDYLSYGYLGRFLDSIAQQITRLIIFAHHPLKQDLQYMTYQLQSRNIYVVNIGPLHTHPYRILHASIAEQAIVAYANQIDAMLIRGPTELLPNLGRVAIDHNVPTALLLVGDYVQGVDDLPQPIWRKEAIRFWAYWNYRRQMKVAEQSLTFVNSRKLYDQFRLLVPNLLEIRTTTLSATDFHRRADTCQARPINLLYTGRIDRAKGLFEIIDSVSILSHKGMDVILNLVGWPAHKDTIIDELLRHAEECNVAERVLYHGFKTVGNDLFEHYRNADIYITASKKSEGFPRTIWEAMAHSVPVITSNVGSIPAILSHKESAWIINEVKSSAIAGAIESIVLDDTTRQLLITNGLQLAQSNTLETRARELLLQIEYWTRYGKISSSDQT